MDRVINECSSRYWKVIERQTLILKAKSGNGSAARYITLKGEAKDGSAFGGISCFDNIECRKSLAWSFAKFPIRFILILGIFSVLLSPFRSRTMKGYYARVVLIIFSGMFSFQAWLLFPCIVWGPFIILFRKYWYPMPGDK